MVRTALWVTKWRLCREGGGHLTHKQLVQRAKNWLIGTRGCTIVTTEFTTSQEEIPDALGFYGMNGYSILCEVKISRSDFLNDKKKIFRNGEDTGMGNERYYYTPKGLIEVEELPEGWGLLEFVPSASGSTGRTYIKKEAPQRNANKQTEVGFLTSFIRRLQLSTCVYVIADESA